MKLYGAQSAGNNPIDRKPTQVQLQYSATGVAPHAATQRATYTVPANRKAQITGIKVFAMRLTAAGAVGIVQAYVQYTPSGGTAGILALAQFDTNSVGDKDKDSQPAQHTMSAGDILAIFTADGSTTGTVNYDEYVTIIEFAA